MFVQPAPADRTTCDQPKLRTPGTEQAITSENHTNQLLDAVEDLLIENSALTTALDAVKRLLPPEAQDRIRSHIEDMGSDPTLRELVRREFAQFRSPSLEGCVSEPLQRHLARGIKSTGELRL